MQLTHAIALLTAAVSVAANPVDIEARQGVPRVRATFYNNGGYCGPPEDWREDTVFVQDPPPYPGVCHDLTVGPFSATYFNESSITRTFRFYNQPCGNLGNANYFDLSPAEGATPGCRALAIRSWVVL